MDSISAIIFFAVSAIGLLIYIYNMYWMCVELCGQSSTRDGSKDTRSTETKDKTNENETESASDEEELDDDQFVNMLMTGA